MYQRTSTFSTSGFKTSAVWVIVLVVLAMLGSLGLAYSFSGHVQF